MTALSVATAELLLARATGSAQAPADVLAAAILAFALSILPSRPGRPGALLSALPVLVLGLGVLLPVLLAQPAAFLVWGCLAAALLVKLRAPLGPRGAIGAYAGFVVFSWGLLALGEGRAPDGATALLVAGSLGACLALGRRAFFLAPLAFLPDAEPEAWKVEGAVPAGPDVVVVTVDTLRLDEARHLHGFEGAFSAQAPAPWTLPSLATLHTGTLPARHGAVRVDLGIASLDTGVPTLAERLGAAGWDTAATVETPFAEERFGLARGFARFRSYEAAPWVLPRAPHTLRSRPFAAIVAAELGLLPAEAWGAERRARDVAELLAARRDRPVFLWVHFLDAHLPYRHAHGPLRTATRTSLGTPDAASLASIRRARAGELARIDASLSEILAALRPGTIVILTSDHGEELGEHGGFEHGHALWQELLAVPLVVRGIPVHGPAGLVDVAPTVLAVLGLPTEGLDGRDLRVAGSTPYGSGNLLYGALDARAVLAGDQKLVAVGETRARYDLAADPGEAHPLPGDPLLEALLPPVPGGTAVALDAATEAALRALGYLE